LAQPLKKSQTVEGDTGGAVRRRGGFAAIAGIGHVTALDWVARAVNGTRIEAIDTSRQRIDQQFKNRFEDWCSTVTISANEQLGLLRVLAVSKRWDRQNT
jgi:hypothetical protein